ncbi:beta-lactamase/transpeptidase-like protein [Chytriomyces cf. hyalinus JEL632]|nr:beta-lactamase/transpeptidase-like protein [Chytriomyces cf. hyalinus JEL632]
MLSQLEEAVRISGVPGVAMAGVAANGTLFQQNVGTVRAGSTKAVDGDTLHPICSVSKAFTVALLAIAADKGRFDWDAPILSYFNEASHKRTTTTTVVQKSSNSNNTTTTTTTTTTTVRLEPDVCTSDPIANQLLTAIDFASHRTGLAVHDPLWYGVPMPPQEVALRLKHMKFNHPIRTRFEYNNNAYKILARLVEILFEMPFELALREFIFEPLGMLNSSVDTELLPEKGMWPHEATLVVKDGKRSVEYADMKFYSERKHDACGDTGITTSVNDLSRWVRVLLNKGVIPSDMIQNGKADSQSQEPTRLISEKQFAKIFAPVVVCDRSPIRNKAFERAGPMNYALGWWIGSFRDQPFYEHDGWNDGFLTHLKILPEEGVAAIVFTNVDDHPYEDTIVHAVLDVAISVKRGQNAPAVSPQDWLARFENRCDEQLDELEAEVNRPKSAEIEPSSTLADFEGVYNHNLYGSLTVKEAGGKLVAERGNIGASPLRCINSSAVSGMTDVSNVAEVFEMSRGRWTDLLIFQFGKGSKVVSSLLVKFEEWNEPKPYEFKRSACE